MPTYDYACPGCGVFEAVRRIAERDTDCVCPTCGAPASRSLNLPALAGRAAPPPAAAAPGREGQGAYGRLRHRAGCVCCSPPVSGR